MVEGSGGSQVGAKDKDGGATKESIGKDGGMGRGEEEEAKAAELAAERSRVDAAMGGREGSADQGSRRPVAVVTEGGRVALGATEVGEGSARMASGPSAAGPSSGQKRKAGTDTSSKKRPKTDSVEKGKAGTETKKVKVEVEDDAGVPKKTPQPPVVLRQVAVPAAELKRRRLVALGRDPETGIKLGTAAMMAAIQKQTPMTADKKGTGKREGEKSGKGKEKEKVTTDGEMAEVKPTIKKDSDKGKGKERERELMKKDGEKGKGKEKEKERMKKDGEKEKKLKPAVKATEKMGGDKGKGRGEKVKEEQVGDVRWSDRKGKGKARENGDSQAGKMVGGKREGKPSMVKQQGHADDDGDDDDGDDDAGADGICDTCRRRGLDCEVPPKRIACSNCNKRKVRCSLAEIRRQRVQQPPSRPASRSQSSKALPMSKKRPASSRPPSPPPKKRKTASTQPRSATPGPSRQPKTVPKEVPKVVITQQGKS
jgi:hypothetical protein